MTPTQKRVFTLLASSQEPMKVEFRNLFELKNVTKLGEQIIGKVERLGGQFDGKLKSYEAAISAISDVIVMASELDANMQVFLKQAKAEKSFFESNATELGVNPLSVAEYRLVEKVISDTEAAREKLLKILNISKNL